MKMIERTIKRKQTEVLHLLVRPGNGRVLLPPAVCSEGNVEAQNEGQWNYFDECRTEYHSSLVVSAEKADVLVLSVIPSYFQHQF